MHDGPTATPYLFVPLTDGDDGTRPIRHGGLLRWSGITVIDPAGNPLTSRAMPGVLYSVRVTVRNLGATAAYAGMATVFSETLEQFDLYRQGILQPFNSARMAFSVPSQGSASIEFPDAWRPRDIPAAKLTRIYVEVADLLLDRVGSRFDWVNNRHAALW